MGVGFVGGGATVGLPAGVHPRGPTASNMPCSSMGSGEAGPVNEGSGPVCLRTVGVWFCESAVGREGALWMMPLVRVVRRPAACMVGIARVARVLYIRRLLAQGRGADGVYVMPVCTRPVGKGGALPSLPSSLAPLPVPSARTTTSLLSLPPPPVTSPASCNPCCTQTWTPCTRS